MLGPLTTGKSSTRVLCVRPKVCHKTRLRLVNIRYGLQCDSLGVRDRVVTRNPGADASCAAVALVGVVSSGEELVVAVRGDPLRRSAFCERERWA